MESSKKNKKMEHFTTTTLISSSKSITYSRSRFKSKRRIVKTKNITKIEQRKEEVVDEEMSGSPKETISIASNKENTKFNDSCSHTNSFSSKFPSLPSESHGIGVYAPNVSKNASLLTRYKNMNYEFTQPQVDSPQKYCQYEQTAEFRIKSQCAQESPQNFINIIENYDVDKKESNENSPFKQENYGKIEENQDESVSNTSEFTQSSMGSDQSEFRNHKKKSTFSVNRLPVLRRTIFKEIKPKYTATAAQLRRTSFIIKFNNTVSQRRNEYYTKRELARSKLRTLKADFSSQVKSLKLIKFIDTMIFVLVIISLIIGGMDNTIFLEDLGAPDEIDYLPRFEIKPINNLLKYVNASIVLLIDFLCISRYFHKLNRMKLKGKITDEETMSSKKIIIPLIVEIAILSIFIPPGSNLIWRNVSEIGDISIYSLNSFIYISTFLKLFYAIRVFAHYSIFAHSWVKIFAKSLKRSIGVKFAFKAQLNSKPLIVILTLFLTVWIIFAIIINSSELKYIPYNFILLDDRITSLYDSLWFVIITMSTVGYGDFKAVTIPGKLGAIISGVLGLTLFTLGIGFFTKFISFDYKQTNVYMQIEHNDLENSAQSSARKVIISLLKLNKFKCKIKHLNKKDQPYIQFFEILSKLHLLSRDFNKSLYQLIQHKFPIQEVFKGLQKKQGSEREEVKSLRDSVKMITTMSEEISNRDKKINKESAKIEQLLQSITQIYMKENSKAHIQCMIQQ